MSATRPQPKKQHAELEEAPLLTRQEAFELKHTQMKQTLSGVPKSAEPDTLPFETSANEAYQDLCEALDDYQATLPENRAKRVRRQCGIVKVWKGFGENLGGLMDDPTEPIPYELRGELSSCPAQVLGGISASWTPLWYMSAMVSYLVAQHLANSVEAPNDFAGESTLLFFMVWFRALFITVIALGVSIMPLGILAPIFLWPYPWVYKLRLNNSRDQHVMSPLWMRNVVHELCHGKTSLVTYPVLIGLVVCCMREYMLETSCAMLAHYPWLIFYVLPAAAVVVVALGVLVIMVDETTKEYLEHKLKQPGVQLTVTSTMSPKIWFVYDRHVADLNWGRATDVVFAAAVNKFKSEDDEPEDEDDREERLREKIKKSYLLPEKRD